MRYFKYRDSEKENYHCIYETNDKKTREHCIWWDGALTLLVDKGWQTYRAVENTLDENTLEEKEITEAEAFIIML